MDESFFEVIHTTELSEEEFKVFRSQACYRDIYLNMLKFKFRVTSRFRGGLFLKRWLEQNVKGFYYVKEENRELSGHRTNKVWCVMFADESDAMVFKMTGVENITTAITRK